MRILHLEDEPIQRQLARQWMEASGHEVASFENGADAIRAVERDPFDLAILDWNVPDVSGEKVLVWIRERRRTLPVIFATSTDEEEEVARILKLGADDYLVKPLRRMEFLARIEAATRRAQRAQAAEEVIELPPWRVDVHRRAVFLSGEPVEMTPRMLEIAILLFRRRGELLSRAQLYELVWGRREELQTRTLDTHVSRLRNQLQLDGRHGWRLASVYQHGYRLEQAAG